MSLQCASIDGQSRVVSNLAPTTPHGDRLTVGDRDGFTLVTLMQIGCAQSAMPGVGVKPDDRVLTLGAHARHEVKIIQVRGLYPGHGSQYSAWEV